MRLTSDFWTAALMRRVRAEGGFAYLTRRGSNEAGTIFILDRRSNGHVDLYGPAPQSFFIQKSPTATRGVLLKFWLTLKKRLLSRNSKKNWNLMPICGWSNSKIIILYNCLLIRWMHKTPNSLVSDNGHD